MVLKDFLASHSLYILRSRLSLRLVCVSRIPQPRISCFYMIRSAVCRYGDVGSMPNNGVEPLDYRTHIFNCGDF